MDFIIMTLFGQHGWINVLGYALVFAFPCLIVLFSIPSILLVALRKRLVDRPDFRKKHKKLIPSFGWLAMFSAITFVLFFFNVGKYFPGWSYTFAGAFLLFITGLKDDVIAITPRQKFIAQFVAAFMIAYMANIRIGNLHGLFGLHEIPIWFSVPLTMVGIVFVTNAYNLIDGVDGLCGSLCLVELLMLGGYFAYMGDIGYAICAFGIAGAILGFLRYNFFQARMFMGDTGSLVLGFFIAVLSIAMVEVEEVHRNGSPLSYYAGKGHIVLAIAVMFVPVFDTFRVFSTRIIHGSSPFKPDRRHLHHILLEAGLNSRMICLTLVLVNISFVLVTILLAKVNVNPTVILLILLFMAFGLMLVAFRFRNIAMERRKKMLLIEEVKLKDGIALNNAQIEIKKLNINLGTKQVNKSGSAH